MVAIWTLMLHSTPCLASDILGFWKNDKQPIWIEISSDSDTAVGTVRRHDERPEAVGRVFLKDLVLGKGGVWRGQIYVERLHRFNEATITATDINSLAISVSVGFMSRTVTWSRSDVDP